jgi:hypothetical protein
MNCTNEDLASLGTVLIQSQHAHRYNDRKLKCIGHTNGGRKTKFVDCYHSDGTPNANAKWSVKKVTHDSQPYMNFLKYGNANIALDQDGGNGDDLLEDTFHGEKNQTFFMMGEKLFNRETGTREKGQTGNYCIFMGDDTPHDATQPVMSAKWCDAETNQPKAHLIAV